MMQPMTSIVTPSQPVAMTTSSRYQTNSGMDHQLPWQHATPHLQQDRSSMERLLVNACESGDDSLVLSLINSGVNVNCLVKTGYVGEWSPLMRACQGGHTSTVKLLLQHGAQIDLQNNDGKTALMVASDCGKMDIAKLLMDRGAKGERDHVLVGACESGDDSLVLSLINRGVNVNCLVKTVFEGEWSPLMRACKGGHASTVKLLLQHGAQIDLRNKYGKTTLMVASDCGKMDIVKLLMDRGAKVGRDYVLVGACRSGDDSLVLSLINSGVNVNCLVETVEGEWSPLMRACEGHESTVKLLLQHGARIDLQDNNGWTALMLASNNGHVEVAQLLLDHGAQIDLQNNDGRTALMWASSNGHVEVAQLLLDRGAQIDLLNNDGWTALIMASDCGNMDIAKLLMDRGAKVGLDHALVGACKSGDDSLVLSLINSGVNVNCLVEIEDEGEWSPLMIACEGRHASTVKLLLQHGAEVDLQDNYVMTALMMASFNGHVEIAQLLLDHGAQIDLQDNNGVTALMMASIKGHVEIAQLLLDHDARVDLEDEYGDTAMNYAKTHEMVDLLMSKMIPKLTTMLQPVAAKWRELGSHLGLNETTLNQCHSSATEEDGRLQAVMNTWSQQNDTCPSWRALIRAVKTLDEDLALQMEQLVGPRLRTHDKDDSDENTNEEEESKKERDDESSRAEAEAHHLAAVEKAIREKGELEHTVAHGAFVGPAGSGKSSLMKRLANEMPSSTSPSTGVAERIVQVEVMKRSSSIAISADPAKWKKILYSDEAIRVIYRVPSSQPPTVTNKPHPLPMTVTEMPHPLPVSTVTTTTTSIGVIPAIESTPSTPVPDTPPTAGAYIHTHKAKQVPSGYQPPNRVFKQALHETQLKLVRQHLKNSWTLYLTDTGGQMEFQEVLPLLVSGPSIFFIIFRLDQDLHQQFTIEYRLPGGGTSDSYQSTLTLEEAILQTLASVASMGTFTYSSSQTRSSPLKPKVLIVGTHKDLLDQTTAKSKIKEIDEYLQTVIKSTAHYDEDLVVFSSESQLIFTVDNFSEDDSDFEKIRSSVDEAVRRGEFKMSYPTHWLIFSLVLRQQMVKDRIISYEQCFTIAQDCGITTKEDLNHALWFLHTKIGLVRHFPTAGLDDIVIRDPQVLFDHVTHLIVDSFTFKNVGKRRCCEFKQKGIFSFEDLIRVSQTESLLVPDKVLKLLKELRIVAPFKTEDGVQKYFIPCVLTHSKLCDSQLPSHHSSRTPPLLITFKCGYCPKGLAGALIVYLLSNEEFKWELRTDRIFRDQISFLVRPYMFDIITLKIHPTYLELVHFREEKWDFFDTTMYPVQSVCSNVCQRVEKGLKKISSEMKLTSDADHTLSFYCQDSDCVQKNGQHPASLERDGLGPDILMCKSFGKMLSSPPSDYSVWLESVKATNGCHDNPAATPSSRKRGPSTSPNSIREPKRHHSSDGITESDWVEVVGYLKGMEKYQIQRLGGVLGLSSVHNMQNLPDDMVRAWLRREDDVIEKCGKGLSWKTLAEKLRKIGQNGIADKILRDKVDKSGSGTSSGLPATSSS